MTVEPSRSGTSDQTVKGSRTGTNGSPGWTNFSRRGDHRLRAAHERSMHRALGIYSRPARIPVWYKADAYSSWA